MNILVYNIAAEYAGAMTVLREFYDEVVSCQDKSHNWYFVVSTDALKDYENIKVIYAPRSKKSWLHRLWYDKHCVKGILEKYNIDLIFSMQNMPISGAKCKQVVYLHQSLQFSPVKYSIWKREERMFWIRQNVICNIIKHSIKKAHIVIVQTNWMKEATSKWAGIPEKMIKVIKPKIKIEFPEQSICEREDNLFIYPAGDGLHKNHKLILQACEILKKKEISHRVIFTMNGDESEYAKKLYVEARRQGLNIQFVGLLPRKEVINTYHRATLLFPSYLETFGLPLLEAKLTNTTILCSDMPFSHEILGDYEKAHFFDVDNAEQLANYMKQCIEGTLEKRSIDIQQNECAESGDGNLADFILKLGNNLVDRQI